jgi:hypothetical protein
MTITGRSPEHDLKATNDGDISNPPAHDPHSTGGINAPRSSHKTASRPSCPATDEHIVLHDGARIMTMPAIRSNPLIPSTSVSSHHGTHTHTVQTSQFHDSECKDVLYRTVPYRQCISSLGLNESNQSISTTRSYV